MTDVIVFSPSFNKQCKLRLTESALVAEEPGVGDATTLFSVNLEDVLGLNVLSKPANGRPAVCLAELCTYSLEKRRPYKKPSRALRRELLEFAGSDNFEDNQRIAEEWRNAIQTQCLRNDSKIFMSNQDDESELSPKSILLIINPFSGTGKGVEIYHKEVQPIFEAAGITIIKEVISEHQGHIIEIVKTFDISAINGIVAVGGDGTLNEVVNGLMSRPDWQTAIKTPVGLLPAGSGNGWVASQLLETKEDYSIANAAFQIARGGVQPCDLVSIQTESNHCYMFMTFQWGIFSDADIESEKFRVLGGYLRDVSAGLWLLLQKRAYEGRLSYLPLQDDSSPIIEEESMHTIVNNETNGETATSSNWEGPLDDLLPPKLSDPVPSTWKTIEGNFVSLVTVLCACVADFYTVLPDLLIGSGEMGILYALDSITRWELFNQLASGNGRYHEFESIHQIRTRAFRLEPITPGRITVDGELLEYGPCQFQLHSNLMQAFSRKRRS